MNERPLAASSAVFDIATAEAIELIAAAARPTGVETVPLADAARRVLGVDLASLVDRPSADDSALDGYACRLADTLSASAASPVALTVVGASHAGRPYGGSLAAGQAVRIPTGAVIPHGADAVIGVENARPATVRPRVEHGAMLAVPSAPGERVLLDAPASTDAVRRRARDLASGVGYLRRGQPLDAANLALAAAMGHGVVTVARRPKVAIIVTGDELVAPGDDLGSGEVYDANGSALAALVTAAGAELAALLRVGDEPGAVEESVQRAADTPGGVDLIVTSGGVSRGERDAVRDLLLTSGYLTFWRVRVRPGGPTMFGSLGEVPVLGLPGNPVSSIVTFLLFARAYLDTAVGLAAPLPYHDRRQALAGGTFTAGSKEVLHRATLVDSGTTRRVDPFEDQSSAVLRSLSESSALVVTPAGSTHVAGDVVEAIPLAPYLR